MQIYSVIWLWETTTEFGKEADKGARDFFFFLNAPLLLKITEKMKDHDKNHYQKPFHSDLPSRW